MDTEITAGPLNLRGHLHKALPPIDGELALEEAGGRGWHAFSDLLFPVLLLKESALRHNLTEMADFCRRQGVLLAPHGKTTMSAQLIRRQLDAGAWGITAANAVQARAMRAFGARRVLIANQVPDQQGARWIAAELAAHPEVEIYSLVDSIDLVQVLEEALAGASEGVRLPVLVEMGVRGGRTGCRTLEEAHAVAAAIRGSSRLRLVGVEGYEGVIGHGDDTQTLARADAFLGDVRRLVEELAAEGAFAGLREILVTAGGSTYFDRVVDVLGPRWDLELPVRVILRSGCYLIHDHGDYEKSGPLGGRLPDWPSLIPAMEIWGVVHARPEPGLVIAGFGKRDVSYDVALPRPLQIRDRNGVCRAAPAGTEVFRLNDQHAFVRVPEDDPIRVGDLLGCGLSHPCTVFDKWRLIPVIDDEYRVLEVVETSF